MLLRHWIAKQGITYQEAARRLGYRHSSGLYDAVAGWTYPRPWRVRAIVEATKGAVTAEDHYQAWLERHQGTYEKKEYIRRRKGG